MVYHFSSAVFSYLQIHFLTTSLSLNTISFNDNHGKEEGLLVFGVSNLKSTMEVVHDAIYCLPLGDIKVHYSS